MISTGTISVAAMAALLLVASRAVAAPGVAASTSTDLADALASAAVTANPGIAALEAWRRHYNTRRPHSALGWRPPAPEALCPPPESLGLHGVSEVSLADSPGGTNIGG